MSALASAKIIPLPTAAALPVVQVPRRGPFSRSSGVVSLGAVRRRALADIERKKRRDAHKALPALVDRQIHEMECAIMVLTTLAANFQDHISEMRKNKRPHEVPSVNIWISDHFRKMAARGQS